jgi:phage protein D
MKYVPFVPHLDSWKHTFADHSRGKTKNRWIVEQNGKGESNVPIQVITPTQQAVDRAKSEIADMKKMGVPLAEYSVIKKRKRNSKKGLVSKNSAKKTKKVRAKKAKKMRFN